MKPPLLSSVWPDTLFTRMVLLIAGLLILGQIALYGFLHTYEYGSRTQRLASLWTQTLILASAISPDKYRRLQKYSSRMDILLLNGPQSTIFGKPPHRQFLKDVQAAMRKKMGEQASILVDDRDHRLWLSWSGQHPVAVGLPMKQGTPLPLPYFKLIIFLLLSLLGGFLAARQISKPLSKLVNTVTDTPQGHLPESVPDNGPRDIRELATRFNHLIQNIKALVQERELMLVGVSHDLRTPLTRIRLASEFLAPTESETRDEIIANVREMDTIIDQFIGYARDGREETREECDLDELIKDIIDRSRGHQADILFNAGLSNYRFKMQRVGMGRLVRNLINNALEHGKPPVSVTTAFTDGNIVLTVSDRGEGLIGYEPEQFSHAFVHGAKSGGIGFGLAIVTRIANDHGGQLIMTNLPEGGFRAQVVIPWKIKSSHQASID